MLQRLTPYLCIFVFLTLVLFVNARFNAGGDGLVMYGLTESLVEHGSVRLQSTIQEYSKFGPLQSILVVPLFLFGKFAASLVPSVPSHHIKMAAVSVFNPIVLSLLAPLVFLVSRQLGLSPRRAFLASVLAVFGNIEFYYAKTFYNDPLTSFLVLASVASIFARSKSGRPYLASSGFYLALAFLTRPVALVLLPGLCWYVWSLDGNRKKNLLRFTWPFLIGLVLYASYNQYRHGLPWRFGYSWFQNSQHLKGVFHNPLVGMAGLLVSPRVGVLYYSPLLLMAPFGLARLAKSKRKESWLLTILVFTWFVSMGSLKGFDGAAWGPRYLIPICPILTIVSCLVIPKPGKKAGFILVGSFLVLNLGLQLSFMLVKRAKTLITIGMMASREIEDFKPRSGRDRRVLQWSFRYMPLRYHIPFVVSVLKSPKPPRAKDELLNAAGGPGDRIGYGVKALGRPDMHVIDCWPSYLYMIGGPGWVICFLVSFTVMGAGFSLIKAWRIVEGYESEGTIGEGTVLNSTYLEPSSTTPPSSQVRDT